MAPELWIDQSEKNRTPPPEWTCWAAGFCCGLSLVVLIYILTH